MKITLSTILACAYELPGSVDSSLWTGHKTIYKLVICGEGIKRLYLLTSRQNDSGQN